MKDKKHLHLGVKSQKLEHGLVKNAAEGVTKSPRCGGTKRFSVNYNITSKHTSASSSSAHTQTKNRHQKSKCVVQLF